MRDSEGGTSHGTTLGGRNLGRDWLASHNLLFFGGTFAAVALLNVLDLWTSVVALNEGGLYEGNQVIVSMAGAFGLQVVGGLLIMKVFAIMGGLAAAVLGVRTRYRGTRTLAVAVMLFLIMVLVVVSVNNIYLISTN